MKSGPIDTDAKRAYCAAQWVLGKKQKAIAREFGYKGPAPACVAISEFIRGIFPETAWNRYSHLGPEYETLLVHVRGEPRRVFAEDAVRCWYENMA